MYTSPISLLREAISGIYQMPIKIELLNRYQLRLKEQKLMLPVIEIKPTESPNLPHVSKVNISVSGSPTELAVIMQSAYKSVNIDNHQPLKLLGPQRLRQNDCLYTEELPPGVACTLVVTVEYFDSDTQGNPDFDVVKEVSAECYIWTPSSEKTELLSESELEPQTIFREPMAPTELQTVYVTGIRNQNLTYPGWFAIDFGTSNSTVTLYDPKVIVTPETLPREQETRLRSRIGEWLATRPTGEEAGISRTVWDSEWQKFLTELSQEIPPAHPGNRDAIVAYIHRAGSTQFLDAIRQIEMCLSKRLDWFRRAASVRLNAIYHEVFRVPALEWQSLIPVELDKDRRQSEIPSELEVMGVDPTLSPDHPHKLKVILGESAKQHRLDAIRHGEVIDGRFLHSPKRYFGQDRAYKLGQNGVEATIPVNTILQAAYAQLIELTDKYRTANAGKCSDGKFYRAVVTYPTVASPFVRREIEHLVRSLDIADVQMAYDEAVSVAIFFLWREFGGDLNVGIESFKTRCHYDGDKWWQNVLVLDIGGGTTDLALIRLTLSEINPFDVGEDRGDGGRYYKLTPKLLGSSGHLQLGGELITLRLFIVLKAAIADCLLTAVSNGQIPKDILKVQPEELSDRFLFQGKFQSGALIAAVDREIREDDAYKDAINAIEKVIPTRWKYAPNRAQTFYTLWEYAEEAKIILGAKRPKDTPPATFTLNGTQIAEILAHNEIQLSADLASIISVTITTEQFERSAAPAIREAVAIAKGLVENAFAAKSPTRPEQVDWLILSGKTCNFELVSKELYRVFGKSEFFTWNQERVTFEPEYTKIATSAGACFAEKLRQLGFSPQQSKDLLRKGANQLYIDVKNLFYFLPCAFAREVIGATPEPIFLAGQELYQLKPDDGVAKYRSPWQGMQLTNNIIRQDFENIKPQLWGSYNGDALRKQLHMSEEEFKNQIKVQFEIDQKLEIDLLLCRGNPHYYLSSHHPYLDLAAACGVANVISPDGCILGDIAVNVIESANALKTDAHTVLFAASTNYHHHLQTFRDDNSPNANTDIGLITELPPFPANGKHAFYFQFHNPRSDQWELIGELPQPDIISEYPCKYYVTLTAKGILRIHAFDVPYWVSNNPQDLQYEGCVYRDHLQPQPNDIEAKRDPFSGEH
ncbi:hypothetical protein NIES3974_32730 [Calothrix sp. NIES-3974]|nr:hypothetical protein NIES3974_32730 [Calothrix sp. NIES-3974]